MSDRERGSAPDDRGPAGQDPAPLDVDRRSFFRSFGRDAVQAAAQLVGAATALQRGSLAATGQLLGGGAASDPLAQLLGIEDPPAVPPAVPFRSPYRYRDGELTLVDQRRLPGELVEVTCHTGAEVAACIRDRLVRGGPVLAQVAAYGVLVAAERMRSSTRFIRTATLHGTVNALRSSRPSSRPMEVALDRMLATWQAVGEEAPGDAVADALRAEAEAIADEAMLDHAALGRAGAAVLPVPFERHLELLVHGPVGALAGGALGTALAIVQEIQVQGREVHAWVPEGRPALQGARVTAFELARLDVSHTVIADAAAAGIVARGRVDAILVAADRIARNGDVSAPAGTYPLAAVAARHGVPVYVCAPLCTVDLRVGDEWGFMEEEGPVDELADVEGRRIPPAESRVHNPVLDVTPADLVRGFVTELGVLEPPFEEALARAVERRRSGSPAPEGQVRTDAPAPPDAPGLAVAPPPNGTAPAVAPSPNGPVPAGPSPAAGSVPAAGPSPAAGPVPPPAEDEDGWGP